MNASPLPTSKIDLFVPVANSWRPLTSVGRSLDPPLQTYDFRGLTRASSVNANYIVSELKKGPIFKIALCDKSFLKCEPVDGICGDPFPIFSNPKIESRFH